MVLFIFVFLFSACSGYVRFGDLQANVLDRQLHSTTHEIVRSKVINLPDERPDSSIGELIEFELFDGEIAIGDVTEYFTHGLESSSWTGDLRILSSDGSVDLSVSDGFFGLSCVERACAAHLYIASKLAEYKICPEGSQLTEDGHGLYVLTQISLSDEKKSGTRYNADFQPGSEAVKKLSSIPKAEAMETATSDADLILDIVVMYTPEAMASIGASAAAMKSLIYLANDQANTVLSNSEVSLRLRVVDIESTASNFTEPSKTVESSFGTLLGWLSTPGDGYLDSAQTFRERYKSDLVLLVNNANAYCGLAWLNSGYLDTLGYANYNVGCLYGSVWMHEIGHILGCYHDRVSDPTSSAAYPTYLGFGSCWENAYKTDCTCYKSVMVYDCNTVPNSCTSCSVKNYLANYNVMNSGNPTGTTVSSCGLHIHNNRYRAIKYRKSIQPGGMIFSVTPKYAINSTCQVVNITGWQFSTSGGDVTSVTLAGVAVTILSQTANSVIVRTPLLAKPTGIAGDVVVTTSTGRITTATAAFTFRTNIIYDVETFTAKSLTSTLWRSNGSLPWSYSTGGDNVMLYKDAGSYSEYEAAELLSYTSPGCSDDYSYLAFQYWAYSSFSFCYGSFTVATRTSVTAGWTTLWTATGYGSVSGPTPWKNISMSLPTGTIGVRLRIKTADVGSCRWWSPVKIDNLAVKKVSTCPSGCSDTSTTSSFVCLPTTSSYKEDFSAKRLNATRWTSNGTLEWTFYKDTATNNVALYKNPSIKSSEDYYAALIHNVVGSAQKGCNDTATFLSFRYWAYSSYGFCDIFSLSSRTSSAEPWLLLWSGTGGTTGSSNPWLNVSFELPLGTKAIRFYAETQINQYCRYHAPFRLDDVAVTYNTYCDGKLSCSNSPVVLVVGPTFRPTSFPTNFPYRVPTEPPTARPSKTPSSSPSSRPTATPSSFPSRIPTSEPSTKVPSSVPSVKPTTTPTSKPTVRPSDSPTSRPTRIPSTEPSSKPTTSPSSFPSKRPTSEPTSKTPTFEPSRKPTTTPTSKPTARPSESPTSRPTRIPSTEPSSKPTTSPSSFPSKRPTSEPTSKTPTFEPSRKPSATPSSFPTRIPTSEPSSKPSRLPTTHPTKRPSSEPTAKPSRVPTSPPSSKPSSEPSSRPSRRPTNEPSARPTPTSKPTRVPTDVPTAILLPL